ncbi:MAG: methyltransferase domain-containing protein, partial [Rhodospirillaceae bacterium]|nr:methyltransferase domain-containing protein [Rhodospirillaceae bacterium]
MNKLTEANPQTTQDAVSQSQPAQAGGHAQFVGSIPEIYDTHLGPLLFQFSGADLARRVAQARPGNIKLLEVACGTGIATEHLWQALSPQSEIVATDLNPAMLDFAKEKRGALQNVSYRQADVQELPFDDGSFDAVACQFG